MVIETRQIKVWESGYNVNVAPNRTLNELSNDNGETFKDAKCQSIDETIDYYVLNDEFDTLTDTELEELVNRQCYDWEGEPPEKS